MRNGGRQFAHAAEPRKMRQRVLMETQLRCRAAMFGNQLSGDQTGGRENEHERLVRGHVVTFSGKITTPKINPS